MNKSIMIRRAEKSDAETIAKFNMAMAWETEEMELDPEVILAGVNNLFEHPEYGFYLVAESGNEVIGTLMITTEWSDWRDGLFWWIQSVYVKPLFRRQGVYRMMYSNVHQIAALKPEVCGFRLYVEKENEIAQSTYKALGMDETHYKLYEELL